MRARVIACAEEHGWKIRFCTRISVGTTMFSPTPLADLHAERSTILPLSVLAATGSRDTLSRGERCAASSSLHVSGYVCSTTIRFFSSRIRRGRTGLGNWTLSPVEPYSFSLRYDDGTSGLLSTRERPKLLLDPSSGEPSHLITAAAPMPPGACMSCTQPRKAGDAKSCVGCKTCVPWDMQVYTMVTPLRMQNED